MASINTSRSSVYQTDGKPLSEEAIYRAKLKYGVYNKPGAVSLGVDHSASDSAALLATSADLSVKPYHRQLSADAATAALIARTDTAPKAWKRENISTEAEYAAISARFPVDKARSEVSNEFSDFEESEDAAAYVLKKETSSVARSSLRDQYDWDDVRSGKKQFSNLNIATITARSNESATKAIDYRTNPDALNSRSGLATGSKFNTANGDVNISKITSAAEDSARKSLNTRLHPNVRDPRAGLATRSDTMNSSSFAASGASASGKLSVDLDYAARERETLSKNTLVDAKVLQKALANAESTLRRLDTDATPENLFNNRENNLKALAIAQQNSEKRRVNDGKIDLGGGLFMDPVELNVMAQQLVGPVVQQIDSKAALQRQQDEQNAQKKLEQKQRKLEYEEELRKQKLEEKQNKEIDKQVRREKLDADKEGEKSKQFDLIALKQRELDGKQSELDESVQEDQRIREALVSEKTNLEEKIGTEAAQRKQARDEELTSLQAERDEEVAPLVAGLERETGILNELIAEREELEASYNEHHTRAEGHTNVLENSETMLSDLDEQINAAKTKLEATKKRAEQVAKDTEVFKKNHESQFASLTAQNATLLAQHQRLEAERDQLIKKHDDTVTELQDAKLKNLQEDKAVNSILPEHLQENIKDTVSVETPFDHSKFKFEPEPFVEESVEQKKPESPKASVSSSKSTSKKKLWSIPKISPKSALEPSLKAAPEGAQAAPAAQTADDSKAKQTTKKPFKKKFIDFMNGESYMKPAPKFNRHPKTGVEPASTSPTATTTAAAAASTPVTQKPAASKAGEPDLTRTFSGFSQGSDVNKS
ncbi:BA75_02432T0 [Komagataella pastoris]|uniref:BA75_02432T0 n=1 Tax=Komagataella pastoris TaxID=4922 RepID=A0A1B2JCL6_PICPA|nr:BA75_02432T0 [Komagataella pastoris]